MMRFERTLVLLAALVSVGAWPALLSAQADEPESPPSQETAEAEEEEESDLLPGQSSRSAGSGSTAYSDEFRNDYESPEYFRIDARVGQYTPDVGNEAFDQVFGDDAGPYLSLEFNYMPLRIPYVGRVGLGIGWGWSRYSADACQNRQCTSRANGEEVELRMFPMTAMGVLEIDVLARHLDIPLVFAAKFGIDSVWYRIKKGDTVQAQSHSEGLRWGLSAALELDFINRRRARSLDHAWGINHTYLVFEIFGSTAGDIGGMPLGTSLGWTAGLGLSI